MGADAISAVLTLSCALASEAAASLSTLPAGQVGAVVQRDQECPSLLWDFEEVEVRPTHQVVLMVAMAHMMWVTLGAQHIPAVAVTLV